MGAPTMMVWRAGAVRDDGRKKEGGRRAPLRAVASARTLGCGPPPPPPHPPPSVATANRQLFGPRPHAHASASPPKRGGGEGGGLLRPRAGSTIGGAPRGAALRRVGAVSSPPITKPNVR